MLTTMTLLVLGAAALLPVSLPLLGCALRSDAADVEQLDANFENEIEEEGMPSSKSSDDASESLSRNSSTFVTPQSFAEIHVANHETIEVADVNTKQQMACDNFAASKCYPSDDVLVIKEKLKVASEDECCAACAAQDCVAFLVDRQIPNGRGRLGPQKYCTLYGGNLFCHQERSIATREGGGFGGAMGDMWVSTHVLSEVNAQLQAIKQWQRDQLEASRADAQTYAVKQMEARERMLSTPTEAEMKVSQAMAHPYLPKYTPVLSDSAARRDGLCTVDGQVVATHVVQVGTELFELDSRAELGATLCQHLIRQKWNSRADCGDPCTKTGPGLVGPNNCFLWRGEDCCFQRNKIQPPSNKFPICVFVFDRSARWKGSASA